MEISSVLFKRKPW